MPTLQSISQSVNAQTPMNENFVTVSAAALCGKRQPVTTGLTWGYYGGLFNGITIADGTVALTNTTDNYVVLHRLTGVVSTATTTTNWNDSTYARLYKLTTAGSVVTVELDARWDLNGLFQPPVGPPIVSVSGAKTFALADANTVQFHPAADTTARTWTIPANGTVAFPVGTEIGIDNDTAGGVITLAITTDTLILIGAGSTGSRTIAASGGGLLKKVTTTRWHFYAYGGVT